MKALVTGAAGFIGARLCRSLAQQGDEVRALVFPGEDDSHIGSLISEAREADITDPAALEGAADGMDVVYHLAARVVDHGSHDDFYKPILDGTRNMLEASAGKAGRFVFVSSICACGTGCHIKGMTEADACKNTGVFYGDAKLAAEGVVRKFQDRFENGCVIVRPANVIGPRSVWVGELGSVIRASGIAYIDGGRYSSSLIHVDNLVDGLLLCGTREEAANQTFFFRDDWAVTWKQYLDDLAAMFDKRIRISIPFGMAWFLGGISERLGGFFHRRPPITRHVVGLMGRDCDVDTTKARTELGWRTRVSYQQALDEIETWVREEMTCP